MWIERLLSYKKMQNKDWNCIHSHLLKCLNFNTFLDSKTKMFQICFIHSLKVVLKIHVGLCSRFWEVSCWKHYCLIRPIALGVSYRYTVFICLNRVWFCISAIYFFNKQGYIGKFLRLIFQSVTVFKKNYHKGTWPGMLTMDLDSA